MNAGVLDRRLLAPRPGLLCGRLALSLVAPMTLLALMAAVARRPAFGVFAAVFVAAQAALVIATAHKEILAASPSFFRVGLRRQLFAAQLVWALTVVLLLGVGLRVAYPALPSAWVGSACGAALAAYALAVLATLRLAWSFQLPLWLYYMFFLMPAFVRSASYGNWDTALGAPWAWLAAGVLLLGQLGRTLASRDVHRRLSGSLVLGVDDLLRPRRIQMFKNACAAGSRRGSGPRWRQWLIAALVRRASAANARGDTLPARAWQVVAVDAAATISPRSRVVAATMGAMLALTVFSGYFDARTDQTNPWFAGLVYQWALFPAYSLSAGLLSVLPGAGSRRDGWRAELLTVGWVTVLTLALALLTAGLFAALAAMLPPLHRGGQELAFTPARPHGIWLTPLLVPVAWLAVALKPRPQSPLVAFLIGPMFIGGHAAFSELPYRTATPWCVAVSLLAFGVAAAVRRRWWLRADLPR